MRRSLTILAIGGLAAAILAPVAVAKRPSTAAGRTGTGTVFLPNPVAAPREPVADRPEGRRLRGLQAAYHDVTLTNLDGSGCLVGDWANVVASTGTPAYSSTNTFRFHRDDDRFEQVMAYYWVTEAQKYIQSLGFGDSRRAVNKESQDIRTNQWGVDNSFSWDKHDLLRFGKGGVDDAEDAEVDPPRVRPRDPGLAGRGLRHRRRGGRDRRGVRRLLGGDRHGVIAPTADPACIADWDSVSYTSTAALPAPHRRRQAVPGRPRGRGPRRRPDLVARAVVDPAALGHVRADTVILEAQFDFTADISMPAAARATVAAAQRLYGTSTANTVRHAFEARGIL